MLGKFLIGWCLMAVCVTIHAMGLTAIFRWMRRETTRKQSHFAPATWMLVRVAGWTLLLHLSEIIIWAVCYVVGNAMPNFTAAAYFSAVTYTTTGYGDLVLPEDWRLVGGIEALTGILMCGLSTGLFFAVFTSIFGLDRDRPRPGSLTDQSPTSDL